MHTGMNTIHPLNYEMQGSLVAIAVLRGSSHVQRHYSTRGLVTEFSPKSRLRILKTFNRLNTRDVRTVHITLTYPAQYPHPQHAKTHLFSLFKRLARDYPQANFSAVWRLEFQSRGAPHFHVIAFGLPYIPQKDLFVMWGDIIGSVEPPSVHINLLRSSRQTMYYVSKYVAKKPEGGSTCFNIEPYLTAEGEFINPSDGEVAPIGRYWGVHNRADLPFAPRIAGQIPQFSEFQLKQFKARALMAWQGVQFRPIAGLCLFVENAEEWYHYLCWIIETYPTLSHI